MEIKVTARHGSLSESTQEAMKAKVAKLPRFFDRTTGIQILADLEPVSYTHLTLPTTPYV